MPTDQFVALLPWLIALAAVIIVAAAGLLAVHLVLRRLHTPRLWERKAEAYTAVAAALHVLKRHGEEELANTMGQRPIPPEREEVLLNRWLQGKADLERAIDTGALLLNRHALERLAELRLALREVQDTTEWMSHLDTELSEVNATLETLQDIARKDLRAR